VAGHWSTGPKTPNVLPLEQWEHSVTIGEILGDPGHRYWFHEDRRDERVYWLHSEGRAGFEIGGPGTSTPHDRPPVHHWNVEIGYNSAIAAFRELG
jgi:hypothetical protein